MCNIILDNCPFCGGNADFIDMYVASVQRYKLWIECSNCGAKNLVDMDYCGKCGEKLIFQMNA